MKTEYDLSLEPDENMRWIYNPSHPDYYSDQAKDLRERRASALRQCPEWLLRCAETNDAFRKFNR